MDNLNGLARLLIFVKNKEVTPEEATTIIVNTINDVKPSWSNRYKEQILSQYYVGNPQGKCIWCDQNIYEVVVKNFEETPMCTTMSCEIYR